MKGTIQLMVTVMKHNNSVIYYISHINNAKIVLLHNLSANYGLVNGAVGEVKDFVYLNNDSPPNLPTYIIVDFPSYTGPSFFEEDNIDKRCWVILLPVTAKWKYNFADHEHRNSMCSRTMFPIRLAWAWTPWKAQGSTFNCPIILHLGNKEREHGLTYTAMSRAKRVEDILLPEGLGEDRLCQKIKNIKKMQSRIEEEKRLQLLHNITINLLN